MRQTLAFTDKVVALQLPELRETVRMEQARGGLSTNRPIEHFNFLDEIGKGLTRRSIDYTLDDIMVPETGTKRIMWTGEKEQCPLQNYLVEQLVTRINLNVTGETELNPSIAVAYNDRGIQIAFGTNVRVCSNMNVYGENFISTYGNVGKVPFAQMITILKSWIDNYEKHFEADKNAINELKAIEIQPNDMDKILGKLIRNAVFNNMGRKEVNAPLNVTQVCRLIEQGDSQFNQNIPATAWDFANWGTYILKPNKSNMTELLSDTYSFNKFVLEAFDVKYRPVLAN